MLFLIGLAIVVLMTVSLAQREPVPVEQQALDAPSPLTGWPWPGIKREMPSLGMTHWTARSPDGTILHLIEFNFAVNPKMRLALYDQDENDKTPHDNLVTYWSNGVGQVTRHLNSTGTGKVLACWNGLFFNIKRGPAGPQSIAEHIAPVVLQGKAYYAIANYRWTVGVQYQNGKPVFKTLHLPGQTELEHEYTYAAAGAQCLIRDGQPLKMQPYPRADEKLPNPPVPSTAQEVGYIPMIDHIRTSRTSMGWSKDNMRLYLLLVREPDNEADSMRDFKQRIPTHGGWMVSDLQRFWQDFGVWGAVNIDGGIVSQATLIRGDGNYSLFPPTWASTAEELTFTPAFTNAPEGGTLMYFYVTE